MQIIFETASHFLFLFFIFVKMERSLLEGREEFVVDGWGSFKCS